ELRMSFRSPFSQLRLSNRATHTNNGQLGANESVSDIWRRKRDSNPRTSYPPFPFRGTTVIILSLVGSFATARALVSWLLCAYRMVVLIVECPSSSFTVTRFTPEFVRREANVCRKMCQVMPLRPARRSAAFQPALRSKNRSPVRGL